VSSTFFPHIFFTTFCVAKALAEIVAPCSAQRFLLPILEAKSNFSRAVSDYLTQSGERSMKVLSEMFL
jgi:hypothetical protein